MMRWLIQTSMRIRYLVVVFAIVLILIGILQLRNAPVDVYPEFDPPMVEVQTEALGLSAEEMEALITVPLEADLLNGVAWLETIQSETVAGLSSILMTFEPGTDPIRARLMVQERLTQTFALPNVSKPPTMLQPLSTSSRVMLVGLSSDDMSLIDMSVLARWIIRPRLMGVPGVANVAIWGQREWQLQVLVDPERLNQEGITLQDVIATSGEAIWVSPLSYLESSSPGTAGWIDTPNQRLGIQHLLPIDSAEDLAQVPIVNHEELKLSDVTNVVEDHQLLIGDALLTDGPGLILVIEKFPNANTVEVTQEVEKTLEALKPGLAGLEIDTTIFRPANYIEESLGNLSRLAIFSVVLVVLVMAVFYFDWRHTLLNLLAITLSLVTAALVLHLRGTTFNVMTLAGLTMALGVIIDDATLDINSIDRRLRKPREDDSGRPASTIVLEALIDVHGPLSFAVLALVLAILPLFTLQYLTALFFQPLAISYLLAILASLAVAVFVTPALSRILIANTTRTHRISPLVTWLQSSCDNLLKRSIKRPNLTYSLVGAVILTGAASLLFMQPSLPPSLKQTDLRIQWEGAPSTSRAAMLRVTSLVTDELKAIPGVRSVGSHVGRAITGDQVVGINSGEIWVNLETTSNYDETVGEVQAVVDGYPGLLRVVETYQPERLGDVLTRSNDNVVVRIYGSEFPVLNDMAEDISQAISGINGIENVHADFNVEEPQVEIEVDLNAAEQHQIKPGDVRREATTLISGLIVGNLYEEQKVFEVVVWGDPDLRNSLSDIQALLIDTPTGQVPLGELADVRIVPSPISIKRDAVQRYVDVNVSVGVRNIQSVSTDIDTVLKSIAVPAEYHVEIVGTSIQEQTVRRNLLLMIVGIVIGLFLLLRAAFMNWRLAVVAGLGLLMALAAGTIAALLGEREISLGTLFGLMTVFGITVRHSVVVISHIQSLVREEGAIFGSDLIRRGITERIKPVLMSILVIVLAFMPLVIAGSIAGTEILHSMAVVVVGGLAAAALYNLFFLPALYLQFGAEQVARVSEEGGSQPQLNTAR